MDQVAGIYGFQITTPIVLANARIDPISNDWVISEDARDQTTFNLTALVSSEELTPTLLFNLEALLAFVERLDVLVTAAAPLDADARAKFSPKIATHYRNSGGGASLPTDICFRTARSEFLRAALLRLDDRVYCERTGFNVLLFKYVESFRQRKPFIEVTWFLLYSGLEAFARDSLNDYDSGNASVPICKLLQSFGFKVYENKPTELPRSVSTYTHLRNALFHNGKREIMVDFNGKKVNLAMVDYLVHLQQLVGLLILKAVNFDDGHINWDSWMDLQPFQ